MSLRQKKYQEYNTVDLRSYWSSVYKSKYNEIYTPKEYGVSENGLLKTLFDLEEDIFVILLAVDNAILKSNVKSIRKFAQNFQDFVPKFKEYAKLQFYVEHFGKEEEKNKWHKLQLTLTRWLPDANVKERRNKIIEELTQWIEEIYGK